LEFTRYDPYHLEITLFEFRKENRRSNKSRERQTAPHTHVLAGHHQVGSRMGFVVRGLHSLDMR
jgi:hypothetical protein